MRKLLLVLLAAIFAIFLAACGEDEIVQPEEVTPTPTPTAEIEPDEDEDDPFDFEPMGLGEAARYMTRAEIISHIPDVTPRGQIILGSPEAATPNILWGWDDAPVNLLVRKLVGGHFLATMASNMDREFFPNPMVTQNVDIRDNADGSRTYTFTIYTQNQFSDGTFINASHYAGGIALWTHEYWANLADGANIGFEILGRNEWTAGEADTLAGVRLYDDETFSVTIDAEWLPYIWETITYMMWEPAPLHAIIPDAAAVDNGDGVFLQGLTEADLTNSVIGATNNGFRFAFPVGAGPYRFIAFDSASSQITLEANPHFPGTWDGYIPRIQTIVFTQTNRPELIDALALGEIDMVSGLGNGDVFNAALTQLVGTTHNFFEYPRHGYDLIRFHVDHGPTQFVSVRQAVNWLFDRDEFDLHFAQGHGIPVWGPYSLSMWWYPYTLQRGLHDRITHYTFNPERAIEILEADGWALNSVGQPFVPGVDDVRYKDVGGYTGLLWFGEEGTTDPSVNAEGLMRLEIKWAVEDSNPTRDVIATLLVPEMSTVGIQLTQTLFDNVYPQMWRTGGANPEFHMFSLGADLALAYRPWTQFNPTPAFLGGGLNTTFSRDYDLFELANQLRFLNIDDDAGRAEFVGAWMNLIEELNYQTLEIPLYAEISYCFTPLRLQNWNMNSLWNFSEAIVRAYVTE